MPTNIRKINIFTAAALSVAITACGGSETNTSATAVANTGTVKVALTDAPACGFEKVSVTVVAMRFHADQSAAEGASGWQTLTLESPVTIDLLDLTDGKLLDLGDIQLPEGTYDQARLILANNKETPDANSVVLEGESQARALHTPSASKSGTKVKLSGVQVAADQTVELVVDFDACNSVVTAGASGKYILKPKLTGMLVTLTDKQEAGGSLGPDGAGALVTAQIRNSDGEVEVLKTDEADASGAFVLSPLPNGVESVDLVIQVPGQPLHILTDVPTKTADLTELDQALVLGEPDADVALTGVVTFEVGSASGTEVEAETLTEANAATITAVQQVGTVPYIAGTTLTDGDGNYLLDLPSQPPVVAAYGETIAFAAVTDLVAYYLTAQAEGFDTTDKYLADPADTELSYDFLMTEVIAE